MLLIGEFSDGPTGNLDGLTKLAKLDFLVRYPAFLEALNQRRSIRDSDWRPPRQVEREAVDSPMIRYKYGPFDDRYYVLIGGLVGRGLAEYGAGRGKVALRLTGAGRALFEQLHHLPAWEEIADRIRFLRRHYDLPGSVLKEAIYAAFPDLVQQPIGSSIEASPQEGEH